MNSQERLKVKQQQVVGLYKKNLGSEVKRKPTPDGT